MYAPKKYIVENQCTQVEHSLYRHNTVTIDCEFEFTYMLLVNLKIELVVLAMSGVTNSKHLYWYMDFEITGFSASFIMDVSKVSDFLRVECDHCTQIVINNWPQVQLWTWIFVCNFHLGYII